MAEIGRNKREKALKTSDFSGINIRTFEAKPRMFALKKSDVFVFPPEKCPKTPEKVPQNPNAPILRYFRARMVSVTSDGLLGALSRPSITGSGPKKAESGKIAHSCIFRSPQHVSAGFYGRSRRFLRHHLAPVVRVVPEAKPANSGA